MNSAVQLYDKDGNPAYPRPYYRIGDFLESTNPNNPGDDGYIGTWELYGKGKVTVCIDTNDNDFNTIGKTSGEKEHTLTIDEMPNHNHGVFNKNDSGPQNVTNGYAAQLGDSPPFKTYAATLNVSYAGGGQGHNNMPPYIVIYRWRRIA